MLLQMTVNGITSAWLGGLLVGESISILTTLRSRQMDFLWEKKSPVRLYYSNGGYVLYCKIIR